MKKQSGISLRHNPYVHIKNATSGITLIALVITIIVLLILAGVSIASVTGNDGMLTRAEAAVEKTRAAEIKEIVDLAVSENFLAKHTNGTIKTKTDIITELKTAGKLTAAEEATLASSDTITISGVEIDFSSFIEPVKLETPVLVTASGASGSSPAEWEPIEGAEYYEVIISHGLNNRDQALEEAYATGSFYWDETLNEKYTTYGYLKMITWNDTTISYEDLNSADPSICVRAIPASENNLASEWSDWYYVYLCLSGETEIIIYDEKEKKKKKKKLKDIKVGDKVITFNVDTKKWEITEVLACDSDVKMKLEYDIWTFTDGTTITTVNKHRFYNVEHEKMMYMDEWNIGDRIYKVDGTMPALVKHEHIIEPIRHYTLVNKNENYIANDCLTGTRDMKPVKLEELTPLDII